MYECVMIPSEKQNPHTISNILKCLSSLFRFMKKPTGNFVKVGSEQPDYYISV